MSGKRLARRDEPSRKEKGKMAERTDCKVRVEESRASLGKREKNERERMRERREDWERGEKKPKGGKLDSSRRDALNLAFVQRGKGYISGISVSSPSWRTAIEHSCRAKAIPPFQTREELEDASTSR